MLKMKGELGNTYMGFSGENVYENLRQELHMKVYTRDLHGERR